MLSFLAAAFLLAPQTSGADDLRSKTDALFAQWNRTDSPGCAIAIFKDGAIVYERGFGMASLELSVPITPQTVFDIGSTSKQFTAACIGLLAQDGKLALDDDIRKFLPEMPAGEKPVTIRQLLNHTSGLRDYIEVMSLAGFREQDRTTAAETLTAITRQKTHNFAPGEKHLYSNTGYFLLAQIVERASQKSLREFARERIFAPLAMRHTEVLDDCTRIVRNKANSYGDDDGGFIALTSDWEQTGDGAVQTTVGDLLLWDENFYSGKVGGAALREMLLARGRLNDGTELDYCSGLMKGQVRGLDIVRHGGAWVGFRAELVRFPAQHFSVACLCNLGSMDASGLAQKVAELWLAGEMSPAKSPAPAAEADARPMVDVAADELKSFVGHYRHDDLMAAVTLENGALRISGPSLRAGRLTPLGKNRFRRERAPKAVDVVFEDGAMRFEFKDGTIWNFTPVVPWLPAADELARFAGKYWSEEIGASLEIGVVDGGLTVVGHRTISPLRLTPFTRDAFTSNIGQIVFQNEKGAVSGFVVDGGRARGLRYARQ